MRPDKTMRAIFLCLVSVLLMLAEAGSCPESAATIGGAGEFTCDVTARWLHKGGKGAAKGGYPPSSQGREECLELFTQGGFRHGRRNLGISVGTLGTLHMQFIL